MSTPETRLAARFGVYHVREAASLGLRRRNDGSFPGYRVLPRVWSLLPPPFRPEARRVAAFLWGGPGTAVGGLHAAAMWGWLDLAATTPVELFAGPASGLASVSFVRVHRSVALTSIPVMTVRMTSAPRTIVRLGSLLSTREFLATFAKAHQRHHVELARVQELVERHPGLPGAGAAARAVLVLAGGPDSIREIDLVQAITALGFPLPRSGVPIHDGSGLITVADFGWDGILLFYDGRPHLDETSRQHDAVRRARAAALGFQVVIVTDQVLADRPLLRRQLTAAFALAVAQGDAVTRLPA